MSVYFNSTRNTRCLEQEIQLLTAYEVGSTYTRMPRVMHMHEGEIEIVYIRKGSGTHIIDGKTYYTKEGDILVYNSGVLHDECDNPSIGMEVYYCSMTNLKISNLPQNHLVVEGKEAVVSSGEYKKSIESIFAILCETVEHETKNAREIAKHLACVLVLQIYNLVNGSSVEISKQEKEMGYRIKTYIDIHYMEDISLKDISESLHISQYYLAHIFKEYQGISPIQYVTRRRIGEAQSLLIHTEKDITQIAITVGYNNSNHFNTVFSKVVGMSPAKYRKHWQKNT